MENECIIRKIRSPKIFFGWWTVLAGGIIGLWIVGFYSYGFSALFKPIAAELGFSRAITSAAGGFGRLEGGVEGPLVGWMSDRHGPKWIIILGILLAALGLILMYFVDSLWAFMVVWGFIVGTGHNTGGVIPTDIAVSNWFVKKRGIALGIKWALQGLSGVLVVPLIAWLITTQDWRMTCVIGGVVMALVGLPLAWFFIKQHRPEYYGLLPDGATAGEKTADTNQLIDRGVEYAAEVKEVEFTVRQALKTGAYWLLVLASLIPSLVTSIMNIHCIPFLTDIGIDPVKAASMMSIYVGFSIPFRFIGGLIADRVRISHLRFVLGGTFLVQAIGVTIFLQSQSIATIYIWFILYGIGMGTGDILRLLLMARYFGRKAYGSIRGSMSMLMAPFGMAAPIYAGWVYDTTSSYISVFIQVAVVLAIVMVIACFVLPPKPAVQLTDVHKIM